MHVNGVCVCACECPCSCERTSVVLMSGPTCFAFPPETPQKEKHLFRPRYVTEVCKNRGLSQTFSRPENVTRILSPAGSERGVYTLERRARVVRTNCDSSQETAKAKPRQSRFIICCSFPSLSRTMALLIASVSLLLALRCLLHGAQEDFINGAWS